jgi:hypothetical protein
LTLVTDLVRGQVAVIAAPGSTPAALATKKALGMRQVGVDVRRDFSWEQEVRRACRTE